MGRMATGRIKWLPSSAVQNCAFSVLFQCLPPEPRLTFLDLYVLSSGILMSCASLPMSCPRAVKIRLFRLRNRSSTSSFDGLRSFSSLVQRSV